MSSGSSAPGPRLRARRPRGARASARTARGTRSSAARAAGSISRRRPDRARPRRRAARVTRFGRVTVARSVGVAARGLDGCTTCWPCPAPSCSPHVPNRGSILTVNAFMPRRRARPRQPVAAPARPVGSRQASDRSGARGSGGSRTASSPGSGHRVERSRLGGVLELRRRTRPARDSRARRLARRLACRSTSACASSANGAALADLRRRGRRPAASVVHEDVRHDLAGRARTARSRLRAAARAATSSSLERLRERVRTTAVRNPAGARMLTAAGSDAAGPVRLGDLEPWRAEQRVDHRLVDEL